MGVSYFAARTITPSCCSSTVINRMEKAQILEALTPIAVLQAITPEAVQSIPYCHVRHNLVAIYQFPFHIGRDSRVRVDEKTGELLRIERQKVGVSDPNNDLYLIDSGGLLNISRAHLKIARHDNKFKIVDRDSACGCLVNDEHFGGQDAGGEHLIEDGDELGIGTQDTPYRFRFIVLETT